MNDEQLFLEAILESPENDVPRLQYADWLEEQGNPCGEFIRLQIELESTSEEKLRIRVRELLVSNWTNWYPPIPCACVLVENLTTDLPCREGIKIYFRRGFIERVTLSWEKFYEYAGTLFSHEPIQQVVLSNVPCLHASYGQMELGWMTGYNTWMPCELTETWNRERIFYPSKEELMNAISRGCVKFGRLKRKGEG